MVCKLEERCSLSWYQGKGDSFASHPNSMRSSEGSLSSLHWGLTAAESVSCEGKMQSRDPRTLEVKLPNCELPSCDPAFYGGITKGGKKQYSALSPVLLLQGLNFREQLLGTLWLMGISTGGDRKRLWRQQVTAEMWSPEFCHRSYPKSSLLAPCLLSPLVLSLQPSQEPAAFDKSSAPFDFCPCQISVSWGSLTSLASSPRPSACPCSCPFWLWLLSSPAYTGSLAAGLTWLGTKSAPSTHSHCFWPMGKSSAFSVLTFPQPSQWGNFQK